MSGGGAERGCGFRTGKDRTRLLACAVGALLAMAGCSPGSTTTSPATSEASPSVTSASASAASSGGPGTTGFPETAFTDAELAAIINGVAQARNLQFPAAQDSARQRSGATSGTFPEVRTETTPSECAAFIPQNPFVRWADKGVSFAEGAMPAGAQSGPATTIMITLRSAEKDAIAAADFGYTADLTSRCSQFDLASTESGRTSTYAVQLLAAPPVGEKQHGLMQNTKPKGPGDYGSVGMRVLAGTLSITLSLAVAEINSESDAKPALDSMADLARQLINQAVTKPPAVAAPAPNSRTPEDVVALFNGVTAPGGYPVTLPGASVIGPPPGTVATPSSQPVLPCTFSDDAYYGSLLGAVLGQGQIPGATKMDYAELTVISMPTAASPPYPFDTRAAALRECTTVQESMMGNSRQWLAISQLSVSIPAEAAYAVAYQLSDGTGEWHVRAGARRGPLTLEANGKAPSQAEAQASADRLTGVFGSVFSNAGL